MRKLRQTFLPNILFDKTNFIPLSFDETQGLIILERLQNCEKINAFKNAFLNAKVCTFLKQ